jgi:hypothetical protein
MLAAPLAAVSLRTGEVLPSRPAAWATLLLALAFLTPLMLTPAFRVLYAIALALLAAVSVALYRGLASS